MVSTEEGWLWWNCTLHTHLSALFRVDEDAPGLFELMLRRVSEEAVTSKCSCVHNKGAGDDSVYHVTT